MFDRVRIKEMAKTALKRRYIWVILAAAIVGLLGGSLADGLTGREQVTVVKNRVESVIDSVGDDTREEDNNYNNGVWGQPTNPWEQQGGANSQQGGTVWDDAIEGDVTWADIWAVLQAEWNNILDTFSREVGLDLQRGLSILIAILIAVAAVIALCAILFHVLVGNVMTVGGHGWMLRHWRGEDVSVGEAFAAFRIYKPSVVTMLVRVIYVWLWSLLLVIPGIVKRYAYSMVPYIIYENPNLSPNEAIKISNKMTKGYKFELFVLNLSFIGWKILSTVTGGVVGLFWANPYMGLTHAGVYDDLKWKAIQNGTLTWEDFGQLPPPPMDPFADVWGTPDQQPTWSNPAPQQPMWDTPAPPQPAWEQPAPQPPAWHTPSDIH